jgi:hypothetical protein
MTAFLLRQIAFLPSIDAGFEPERVPRVSPLFRLCDRRSISGTCRCKGVPETHANRYLELRTQALKQKQLQGAFWLPGCWRV